MLPDCKSFLAEDPQHSSGFRVRSTQCVSISFKLLDGDTRTLKMMIDEVRTTGAALASLLQSMARNDLDFDGLILGRYERRTKSTLHDDRAEETFDSLEACITSFQSFASVCSFYDPAGQIIGEKLAALVLEQQETVLGWFVSRRAVWAKPSARDSAVCAHLPVCLARLQPQTDDKPLLFGVFTAGEEHSGATLGFQQRLYQQLPTQQSSSNGNSSSGAANTGAAPFPVNRLRPVPMRIANLGSARGARIERGYEPMAPVAGLPRVVPPVPVSKESTKHSDGPSSGARDPLVLPESELQQLAVADVQRQVAGVEALYKALISQVSLLEAEAEKKAVQRDSMLAEIDAIT
ncbi:probable BRCA1-A complex subunit Abraxas 1 [Coccomyxa sp. Obi]|nr:probable BRCA1-A complex subunit Abraxas 1 [Coccomyxa sp. Obi]